MTLSLLQSPIECVSSVAKRAPPPQVGRNKSETKSELFICEKIFGVQAEMRDRVLFGFYGPEPRTTCLCEAYWLQLALWAHCFCLYNSLWNVMEHDSTSLMSAHFTLLSTETLWRVQYFQFISTITQKYIYYLWKDHF